MKFKIHFEVNGYEDYYIIEAETVEEVRKIAKEENDKRGLDVEKNNLWSEKI